MRSDTTGSARRQRSLVGFYGPKPAELKALLTDCQAQVAQALGDAFAPYAIEQIHGTLTGLEDLPENAEVGINANFARLRGQRLRMDIPGYLAALELSRSWPLQLRFGGFSEADRPFRSRGALPWERCFSIQGDRVVLIGWPVRLGEPDAYPATLAALRRQAEAFNILHVYHADATASSGDDNDFYLRLGTLRQDLEGPEETLESVTGRLQHELRESLAAAPVTVPLSYDQLRIVNYDDPCLPCATTDAVAPHEFLARSQD